jgi:hypothetical protein
MTAALSTAVAARRVQPRDSLDFFPTPPWGTRALAEYGDVDLSGAVVWEPACGRGHMARPLAEVAHQVHASDIADRGYGARFDFLSLDGLALAPRPVPGRPDWVITNPPFAHLARFFAVALREATRGVAFLGRLQLLEGADRYATIFQAHAGHVTVLPFVERLPIEEGCCAPDTSTASAYAWLIVDKRAPRRSPLVHIPPCRARLERLGDYDDADFIAEVRRLKAARKGGGSIDLA